MRRLLRQAFGDMLQSLGTTLLGTLFPVSIALAIFLSGAIVATRKDGHITVSAVALNLKDGVSAAFVAVAITLACWALLYAYYFVRAANRVSNDTETLKGQIDVLALRVGAADRRIEWLLRYLPRLSSSQLDALAGDLKEAAMRDNKRGTVFIQYVDTPTSGAMVLAYQIEVAFERAGWRIERKPAPQSYENTQGVMMFTEKPQQPTPRQRDVIAALAAAEIRLGYYVGSIVTDDRVELIVGSL